MIQTEVKIHKGAPAFMLNGKPFTVPVMETYRPEEYYFRQFAAAGCRVFSFNTNAARCDYGHSTPIWPEKDRMDFAQFDERMENILRHNPNALVMPRVMFGTPDWWLLENPDELLIMSDGKTVLESKSGFLNTYPTGRPFPSIASQKWRNFMVSGVRRLIDHIEEKYHDNFFGLLFSGMHTEEWYHWNCHTSARADYSPHMRAAFCAWLRCKYKDEAALRIAWNRDITFDAVEIPSQEERESIDNGTFRDTETQMNVVDFYCFYNEIIPDTIDFLARGAKEHMPVHKVIGAFYAYMYEYFGDPEFGHNGLGRYNDSESLDFVFVTASYDGRQRGTGADYQRAPAYSAALHNKLWYHDNDVASFLTPSIMSPERGFTKEQAEFYCEKLGVTKNATETIDMYRRCAGFVLTNGMFESYFDLHGGYFDHPELLKEVSTLNRMFERSANFARGSNAEILIIADEESNSYASYRSDLVSRTLHDIQVELTRIGAGTDHILSRDIGLLSEDDLKRYKLVIVLNCYALDDERRGQFKNRLQSSGRTVLFCYAAGLYNGHMYGVEHMRELTGIDFALADGMCGESITLTPAGQELFDGVYAGGQGEPHTFEEIYVADSAAESLGLNEHGRCVFACKQMEGWTSIYHQSPALTAGFLRKLAKMSNVHIYSDSGDVLYAGGEYLVIHAASDGRRVISFPQSVCIFDAISETELCKSCAEYELDVKFGVTYIFRCEPCIQN